MASPQQEPTGTFHIVLRIGGERYKRSLRTKSESAAIGRRDGIVKTLDLVTRSRLKVPEGVSLVDFVLTDGKVEPPVVQPGSTQPRELTLKSLLEQFFNSIPAGNIEDSTQYDADSS